MGSGRKVGSGSYVYEEIRDWAKLPSGWAFEECPGVAVNSKEQVYVLSRSVHPVTVFDSEGSFLTSWGEGLFTRPHFVLIGPDDSVYIVDDVGNKVCKFTPDGKLLFKIDRSDRPADTGYGRGVQKNVLRAGPPFNTPTGLALSPEGDIYVSDGYGNARIHKFSADGTLLFSWGEPGSGPGEFKLPHGVVVDKSGLVYVSDRMNARMQVFNPQGKFITEWKEVRWPDNMCIDSQGTAYVAEVGAIYLLSGPNQPDFSRPPARTSVRDLTGKILAEWGEDDPTGTGKYYAPHGIAVDSQRSVYVSEVALSYTFGAAPKDWPAIRKYVRVGQ